MSMTSIIAQSTIPLLLGLGLAGLAGASSLGRQRQTVRIKVRKRP